MNSDLQRELMLKALCHIEAHTTDLTDQVFCQPASHYFDPVRAEDERRLLFSNPSSPLLIAMSCSIPHLGDYITDDLTGVPLLVVRGQDGVARVFRNACQHRGARITEGCGHARALTCPYHGWTYSLDGSLKGIPDKESFPGVLPAEHGLKQLPTAERHGMIWALPHPAEDGSRTFDITEFFGGLDAELETYKIGSYHQYHRTALKSKMNWKLVIDSFLEAYHFGVLHRDTVARIFIHNLSMFEGFGMHLREMFPRSSIISEKVQPGDEQDALRHNSIIYLLFPNTVIINQVDHLEVWRIFPQEGKPEESRMELDFLIPAPAMTDSARGHWERSLDLTVRTVLNEDFATAEGIQQNYSNGSVSHATIGRCEPALEHFERTVNEQMILRAEFTARMVPGK